MRGIIISTIFIAVFSICSYSQNISDVLENAISSVVTVAVYQEQDVYRILGFDEEKTRGENIDVAYDKLLDISDAAGSGSGFIISKNGKKYVITNAHVIETASDLPGSIYVYSINRNKYEVKIVGGDSFYDIAVLEFIDQPGKEVTTIDWRKTDLRLGEQVYAIGNPLGKYPYSVSEGIISGLNRIREGVTGKFGFLQTTATLIWGNSGGPLIDTNGKVVGINSQIEIVEQGYQTYIQPQINFALEAQISKRLVDDIIDNHGFVKRAYIGVELSQTYYYNDYWGTYYTNDSIPIITGIVKGSPAEAKLAGKVGYKILKINGNEVRSTEEALGEFEKTLPSENLEFVITNGVKEEKINIKSAELQPQNLADLAKYVMSQSNMGSLFTGEDGIYVKMPEKVGNYRVMSAGITFENYQQMWKVKNLTDFGAALRFAGLYGVLDFYVINSEDYTEDLEYNRIVFSGEEYTYKITLWY